MFKDIIRLYKPKHEYEAIMYLTNYRYNNLYNVLDWNIKNRIVRAEKAPTDLMSSVKYTKTYKHSLISKDDKCNMTLKVYGKFELPWNPDSISSNILNSSTCYITLNNNETQVEYGTFLEKRIDGYYELSRIPLDTSEEKAIVYLRKNKSKFERASFPDDKIGNIMYITFSKERYTLEEAYNELINEMFVSDEQINSIKDSYCVYKSDWSDIYDRYIIGWWLLPDNIDNFTELNKFDSYYCPVWCFEITT